MLLPKRCQADCRWADNAQVKRGNLPNSCAWLRSFSTRPATHKHLERCACGPLPHFGCSACIWFAAPMEPRIVSFSESVYAHQDPLHSAWL